MRVDSRTQAALDGALAGEDLMWDEVLWLVGLPLHSADYYALIRNTDA